jgi:hypothetical protein
MGISVRVGMRVGMSWRGLNTRQHPSEHCLRPTRRSLYLLSLLEASEIPVRSHGYTGEIVNGCVPFYSMSSALMPVSPSPRAESRFLRINPSYKRAVLPLFRRFRFDSRPFCFMPSANFCSFNLNSPVL